MASIIQRTINGITDNRIVLKNEQIGRSFSFGSDWRTLGVGVRLCVNLQGTASNGVNTWYPQSYFGFCSGTSNMVKDYNTTNWIGFTNYSVAREDTNTNNPSYWYVSSNNGASMVSYVKQGTVAKVGSALNYSLFGMSAAPLSGSSWMYFQIAKGSPNWTIGMTSQTTFNSASICTRNILDRDMEDIGHSRYVNSPYWILMSSGLYGNSNAGIEGFTIPFDESSGSIDTFNIYWNESYRTLEISDIVIARIN